MNLAFRNDLENSERIDLDSWKRRPLLERINEFIAGDLQRLL